MNLLRLITARKPSVDYAQLFIDAAGITDPTEKSAIKQLVADLQSYGLWSKMKAVYPMVGGTSTSCKYNLINPADTDAAFRIVFSAGWTFSSSGAAPSNAYADTKILPTAVLSISSAHLATYINTTPNNGVLMGNNAFSCFLQLSGALYGGVGSTSYATAAASQVSGFYSVNRSPGSTIIKLIKNGTVIANTANYPGIGYSNAQNIFLGNYNTGTSFASDARIAFSSIGDGLSDTDESNLYTAVQAFQTTLGRQV